jgi:hypothetical protein
VALDFGFQFPLDPDFTSQNGEASRNNQLNDFPEKCRDSKVTCPKCGGESVSEVKGGSAVAAMVPDASKNRPDGGQINKKNSQKRGGEVDFSSFPMIGQTAF